MTAASARKSCTDTFLVEGLELDPAMLARGDATTVSALLARLATTFYMADGGEAARLWLNANTGAELQAGDGWGRSVTGSMLCRLARNVAGWKGDASWDEGAEPARKTVTAAIKAIKERTGGFNSAQMLMPADVDQKKPSHIVAALQLHYWMKTLDPLRDDGSENKPKKAVTLSRPGGMVKPGAGDSA